MNGTSPFAEWLKLQTFEDFSPPTESAVHPYRPVFCVDWDGVCVYEVNPHTGRPYWPDMGPWMPGAIEGLRSFSEKGRTVIHSLRMSPLYLDCVTRRPESEWLNGIDEIRNMLDDVGLANIGLWTLEGKPPASIYIDDRGYRFKSWVDTMNEAPHLLHNAEY